MSCQRLTEQEIEGLRNEMKQAGVIVKSGVRHQAAFLSD
jgi:hypothetical protein